MKYAKALAAAGTVLVTYTVAQFGLELPEEVTGALTLLLTAIAVAVVPNKEASS